MSSAPSPFNPGSGPIGLTVKTDGRAIDDTIQVLSVETDASLNAIPTARIEIADGSAAEETFEVSDQDSFVPGKTLSIAAFYDGGKEQVIFEGTIIGTGLSIDGQTGSKLIVRAAADALVMTLTRRNAVFSKTTDADVLTTLITRNGLQGTVAATQPKLPEIVQYDASDWDMMLARAEANAMVVRAAGDTVTVGPPDTKAAPVLTLTYGRDIQDLQLDMDASTQVATSAITSRSWDPATQKLLDAGPGGISIKEPGNLSSAVLSRVFGLKEALNETGAQTGKAALQSWSTATATRAILAKIRGSVLFQGSALVTPGSMVALSGLGARYNGDAYVSGVAHVIRNGDWKTEVTLGLPPMDASGTAPAASGLVPGIEGLQTGIVKSVADDPQGDYRVEITLPLLAADSQTVWARLSTFYASNKVGAVFYPEVGDEVIVGFMNQDPGDPVILGSVYSKKRPPPAAPTAKNDQKSIVTRSKMEIGFDEKDKILTLTTPGKHSVELNDKTGAVTIRDSNKNEVKLAKSGVSITSASNLTLKSKSNMTIEAGANLALKATANASIDALQISNSAKTKFLAEGSATADLKSSGIVTVKGTLVKIN